MLIHSARLLTLAGPPVPRRGADLRALGAVERGWIRIEADGIAALGEGDPPPGERDETTVDAAGRVVMPAFVDCHTHACWAGERFDELERRLAGASYLEILESGGGIMSTVRATRAAPRDRLVGRLRTRLGRMAALGTATVEVKSGYGLDPQTELKMLEAIREAGAACALDVVPTFLGAHAMDPEQDDFVERTIIETLPAVARAFPGIACDAYCEQGAWSLADTRRLFEEAMALDLPLRVHSDQFHSLGMTRLAVEMGARSVDHLEAVTPADLEHLVRSDTIAVALPVSGFCLDDRYAPARDIVDAGGALAVATNYNPGSAPSASMPLALALACRKLRLTAAEAIAAATINGAAVLGRAGVTGSLEVGKRADVQMLDTEDEREVALEIAGPGPLLTIAAGEIVHRRREWG